MVVVCTLVMWMVVFVSVRNLGTPLVACLVRVIGEESVRATGCDYSAGLPCLQCYKNICSSTKIVMRR